MALPVLDLALTAAGFCLLVTSGRTNARAYVGALLLLAALVLALTGMWMGS